MSGTIRGCVFGALVHLGEHRRPLDDAYRLRLCAELEDAYQTVRRGDPAAIVAAWRDRQPSLFDVDPE